MSDVQPIIRYSFRNVNESYWSIKPGWADPNARPVQFVYVGDLPEFENHPLGEVIDGQRSEKYLEGEFTATMSFICDWDSRFYWRDVIWNSVYPYPLGNTEHGRTFKEMYYLPFCTDVSISTFAEVGRGARLVNIWALNDPRNPNDPVYSTVHYTMAKITANYKGYARPGLWNVDIQYSPQIEARTLPVWGFRWQSDKSPIVEEEAPTIMDYSKSIDLSFRNVEHFNPMIEMLDGCVFDFLFNDSLIGRSFAPGTVLFTLKTLSKSDSVSRDVDIRFWTIGVQLVYNPIGWNRHRRPNALINYGSDDMYVDTIVREDGSLYLQYPHVTNEFDLFAFITDDTYQCNLHIVK